MIGQLVCLAIVAASIAAIACLATGRPDAADGARRTGAAALAVAVLMWIIGGR